jgi:predicted AAA+ superfamily ATPase
MKRKIDDDLAKWKSSKGRKPLILSGPRQVGKTYALKYFGSSHYKKTHYLNFELNPGLSGIFEKDLNPTRIVQEIRFALNAPPVDPEKDLFIFDEIQSAPRALTSLKYFAEERPDLSICCAGSLLGIHLGEGNFPVGKVDILNLHPFSFEEFLGGIGDDRSRPYFTDLSWGSSVPAVVHDHLWDMLKVFLVVGGLPEVVATYAAFKDDLPTAFEAVRKKQGDLLTAYLADVAKHSGKENSMHIERVWHNVPAQMARELDGSSSKFRFKGVVPGISGYSRLVGAIDWLKTAGLVHKIPILQTGRLPFSAFQDESVFKLYPFDVGLLGALGGLSPKTIMDYDFGTYKGYVAENFVLQELIAAGAKDIVCWHENTAEVEFLLGMNGAAFPIEVKSGRATRSKSLNVFAGKYHPPFRTIMSARPIVVDEVHRFANIPLYLAGLFPKWANPHRSSHENRHV